MDESNMMEKLLLKGDRLKPKYENFDYSNLNSEQIFWLDKLSLYSKYRQRIINRYNGTYISNDIKIMFLDQHSMRIGTKIFYNLEA